MAQGKHLLGRDRGQSAGTESLGFPLGCPPAHSPGVNAGDGPLASAGQPCTLLPGRLSREGLGDPQPRVARGRGAIASHHTKQAFPG